MSKILESNKIQILWCFIDFVPSSNLIRIPLHAEIENNIFFLVSCQQTFESFFWVGEHSCLNNSELVWLKCYQNHSCWFPFSKGILAPTGTQEMLIMVCSFNSSLSRAFNLHLSTLPGLSQPSLSSLLALYQNRNCFKLLSLLSFLALRVRPVRAY